jgi:membrane fusion protein, heavy metal efflux system
MKNLNNINKGVKKCVLLFIFLYGVLACGKKEEVKEEKLAGDACCATKFGKVGDEHHESETQIASLTADQMKAIGIAIGSLEEKQLAASIKANGSISIANNHKANVTSLYAGVVQSIYVQEGAYVRKGQLIATISNPQYLELQEEYLSLASKITFAEQEVQRQKELNDGNAGATKNLQSANAELSSLKTRSYSLKQQLQFMGIDISKIKNGNLISTLAVKSPMNGTISRILTKIGAFVDASNPLAEMVDASQLHLDLSVFEKDLPLLKNGQTIQFTLSNNPAKVYEAKIYSIGTAFELGSKTIPVHATILGDKTALIDGMSISAIVSLSNISSLAVPTEAIVSEEGKDYIFVLTDKKVEEAHDEHEEHGEEHHEEEEGHDHDEHEGEHEEEHKEEATTNFEKIEVIKGGSSLGYITITSMNSLVKGAKIVTKGAFFVNAKLTNKGEGHSH